jgi:hypothetical protein
VLAVSDREGGSDGLEDDACRACCRRRVSPPFGGLANHVQRLMALLDAHGIDYVVYNVASPAEAPRVRSVVRWRRFWLIRFVAREPTVYLLTAHLASWIVGALLARVRRKHVAIRLRNSLLLDLFERAPLRARLAVACLRAVDAVVCVNADLAAAIRKAGVPANRVHVFQGFLPPLTRPEDRTSVPKEVWEFAADRDPLISANGRVAWHAGEDLYGLDLLVCLAQRLVGDFPRIGIAVCFWDHAPEDEPRLRELREQALLWGYVRRAWAERMWARWYRWAIRSRLEPVKRMARMIKKHWEGVMNTVTSQVTNARAEAINSRVQWVKRMACGFRNRDNFRNAIYFHLGGLDLYPEALKSTHSKV